MPGTEQASSSYILCHVHSGSRKPQQSSLHLRMGGGGYVTQPKICNSETCLGPVSFLVAVTRTPDGIA